MNKIVKQLKLFFNRRYPQNFLVNKPLTGMLVFFAFTFLFAVVYRPLHLNNARSLSFSFTMLLYCLAISVPEMVMAFILNRTNCFSKGKEWTLKKELLSVVFILLVIGISAYFAGFIIEEPAARWNLPTFFDSLFNAVLIAVVPVFLLSIINIRYLLTPETVQEFKTRLETSKGENPEDPIQIISRAKKEELSFLPGEFIYAESEGNYVVFHLTVNDKPRKVIIRNSISNIETQLADIPHFIRIHRAFIVNLKKVKSKTGNSLGYRLKLAGSDDIIPVSRKNTQKFDRQVNNFT